MYTVVEMKVDCQNATSQDGADFTVATNGRAGEVDTLPESSV